MTATSNTGPAPCRLCAGTVRFIAMLGHRYCLRCDSCGATTTRS